MTEPVVVYTVREMFNRIEGQLEELDGKVEALEGASALRLAEDALRAARRALVGAVASPVVAGLVVWWVSRR